MSEPQIQVMLALEVAADPIAGTLRDGDGSSARFVGWVELAAVLGTMLERAGADADTDTSP